MMKILFLGGNEAKSLAAWLEQQGENIIYRENRITVNDVRMLAPDFIVSYNYQYLLSKEIIDEVNDLAVNLHISLLPYNRGSDPNVWSFLEGTPKGVTIHKIDEGIDTGDILLQKEIYIDEEKETLKSSYTILNREIQTLFKENWEKIKHDKLTPQPQIGKGSIHYGKEFHLFEPYIKEKGWDISIKEFKAKYNA